MIRNDFKEHSRITVTWKDKDGKLRPGQQESERNDEEACERSWRVDDHESPFPL